MKPPGPLDRSGASKSSPGRAVAGVADFAWPPSVEDLEGCGIIDLAAAGDANPGVGVFVRLADVLQPAAGAPPGAPSPPHVAGRPIAVPRPGSARSRHWGVERPDVAFPFSADADDPRVETSPAGETWRALVAVAAGLSLAVLSYAQFRGSRGDATALVAALTEASASRPSREAEITIEMPAAVADAVRQVSPRDSASPASDAPDSSSVTGTGVQRVLTRLAADVIDDVRPTEAAAAAATVEPVDIRATAEPVADVRPQPAVLHLEERPADSVPVVRTAAHVDPVPGDEDHIRAALTRWRTAYSELDARAAREVWPSVDAPALERAFQALKSQDLRFDRCDLTVNGGSAQAACRGRAVYVPRVGNQSPKAAPREWTFELKKLDERWTIASARAS
jgi:hypothetical protein